jgi:hypothetical protein
MLRIAPRGVTAHRGGPGFFGNCRSGCSRRLRQTTYGTAIRASITCSMKITLRLLTAISLVVPEFASGQTPIPVTRASDSIPIAYTGLKANRAGISSGYNSEEQHLQIQRDSGARNIHVGARIQHGLVGALVGTLAGLVIGGGIGAAIDSKPRGDAMFPATPFLAAYGGIAGLAGGLLVGAVWPVR